MAPPPLSPLVRQLLGSSICFLPLGLLAIGLLLRRRQYDRKARLPFTVDPVRLPGQTAREEADRLWDAAFDKIVLLLIAATGLATWYSLAPIANPVPIGAGLLGVMLLAALLVGMRMNREISQSWNHRLGSIGEQVIGRELDRLIALGHRVFHDVPFEGWNIDHVVVGPTGVFAVETKTFRKPILPPGEKARVILDGESLQWAAWPAERRSTDQARRNAGSLAKWIAAATAEAVPVVPVLAIPGWFLTVKRYGDVAVYTGSGMSDRLTKRGKSRLLPAQIQRIAFQLADHCSIRESAERRKLRRPGRGFPPPGSDRP